MTYKYAQSAYGIITLNETLPPYMARNYTLAPFKPIAQTKPSNGQQGTWIGITTMYFLELSCEDASHKADNSKFIVYKSSGGCNLTTGLSGNATIGDTTGFTVDEGGAVALKEYMGLYIGYVMKFPDVIFYADNLPLYSYHNGDFADYSLDASCPKTENTTFYAAFARNKASTVLQNCTSHKFFN